MPIIANLGGVDLMTKIESVDQNVRWDPHVLSCRPPHAKVKGRKKAMLLVMVMMLVMRTMVLVMAVRSMVVNTQQSTG